MSGKVLNFKVGIRIRFEKQVKYHHLFVCVIYIFPPFEIELNVFIQECDGEEGEVEDGAYGGEYEYVEGISEKIIEGIAEKKILKVLII